MARNKLILIAMAAAVVAAGGQVVSAATYTWTGATADWTTAADWSNGITTGTAPGNGDLGIINSGIAEHETTAQTLNSGAALQINTGGTFEMTTTDTITNAITLNGGKIYTTSSGYIGGLLTVTAASTIEHQYNEGYTGGVTGSGRITAIADVSGSDISISGNNTGWSGGLTIQSGVVQATVDGALGRGSVLIDSGATLDFVDATTFHVANTLAGNGIVTEYNGKNVSYSGMLSPGLSAGTAGTLTIQGFAHGTTSSYLTYVSGSATLDADLNGAADGDYDVLHYTDVTDLTGLTLDAALNYAPSATDKLFIVQTDGTNAVVGNFTGLLDGATVTLDATHTALISYDGDFATNAISGGNDVVLYDFTTTTVPEPATLGMLALGGLALINRRRRV